MLWTFGKPSERWTGRPFWTQGPNFRFRPGEVLYDTPQGYEDWSEALKRIKFCLQIKAARPNSSGGGGGVGTAGLVTFDVHKPTPDGKALAFEANHSLSPEAFVRFLISGTGLPESKR